MWHSAPKTLYLGIDNLKIAVLDAITCFDDGYSSRLNIFEEFGFQPSFETAEDLLELDREKEAAKGRPKPLKRKYKLYYNPNNANDYLAGAYHV